MTFRIRGGSIRDNEGTELLTDMDNGELYYPEAPTGSGSQSSVIRPVLYNTSTGNHTEPVDPADKTHSPPVGSIPESPVEKSPGPGGIAEIPVPDFVKTSGTEKYNDQQQPKKRKLKGPRSKRITPAELLEENGTPFVDIETDPSMREYEEEYEAEKRFVMSSVNMTFPQAMKESPLSSSVPYALRALYRSWIIEKYDDVSEDDLPMKGTKIRPGIKLVCPYGKRWDEMVEEKYAEKSTKKKDQFEDEFLTMRALEATYLYVKGTHEIRQMFEDEDDLQLYANGATGLQDLQVSVRCGMLELRKRRSVEKL